MPSKADKSEEGVKQGSVREILFLLGLFAVSGAACLIYEVVWVRQLTTVLGASTYAVSIVLCAFMAGLGLGAWFLGKKADGLSETGLVRVYIGIEMAIGLYALLFPFILKGSELLYVLFYQGVDPEVLGFNLFRFFLAFIILVIPTLFMGATLPVLSRYLIRRKAVLSRQLSFLYAANTAGAILGTVIAGYFLLPAIGIMKTTLAAVFLNLTAAFGLWLCHRFSCKRTSLTLSSSGGSRGGNSSTGFSVFQKVVVMSLAFSGMAAMFYEVAWTRTLAMVLGNTTFAFTSMLATFLLGIAAGSAFYSLLPGKLSRIQVFVGLQLLAALMAILTIPLFEKLPVLYLSVHENLIDNWLDMQLIRFALAALVMLPATFALGAVFPAVAALLVDEMGQLGERLGKAYALNTLGAVIGAGLAGLVLVPIIGMQKTILLGALINLLAGLATGLSANSGVSLTKRLVYSFPLLAVALAAGLLVNPWEAKLLNSGVYLYAGRYENMEDDYLRLAQRKAKVPVLGSWDIWEMAMRQYDLLYYNPGATATVGVMERDDGVRFLTIDGKTDASTGKKSDMRTQVMIGQLPMLLHDDPDKALIVGLGSGVTAGSVLSHEVRLVDCAEISPAVVEAASYFKRANHDVLSDPRLRIIPRDARNILLTEEERYDVIISQPSNPWIKGEASLFTREWYQLVKKSLQKNGLFLQWVPSYLISERDLKTIAHTLRSVFPHLTVWNSGSVGDLIFLARKNEGLKVNMEDIYSRLAREKVLSDIVRTGIDPMELPFSLYLMGEKDFISYLYRDAGKEIVMNTDDNMILEFSSPHQLVRKNKVNRFTNPEKLQADTDSIRGIIEGIDKRQKRLARDEERERNSGEAGKNI